MRPSHAGPQASTSQRTFKLDSSAGPMGHGCVVDCACTRTPSTPTTVEHRRCGAFHREHSRGVWWAPIAPSWVCRQGPKEKRRSHSETQSTVGALLGSAAPPSPRGPCRPELVPMRRGAEIQHALVQSVTIPLMGTTTESPVTHLVPMAPFQLRCCAMADKHPLFPSDVHGAGELKKRSRGEEWQILGAVGAQWQAGARQLALTSLTTASWRGSQAKMPRASA